MQTRPDTRCQGGEIGALSAAPGKVSQHTSLPVICGEVEIPGCLNKTHTHTRLALEIDIFPSGWPKRLACSYIGCDGLEPQIKFMPLGTAIQRR